MPLAEPLDLGAQVLLGVEPGPGDAGRAATASKVMRWPVASMRRSAAMARSRVRSARRRAAAMTWRELSARIGGLAFLVLLDLGDHAVQVGKDLLVHLRHAGLALAGGDLDQGERAVTLLAQLGQELRS